ncbi:DedA family protein [Amycolatopsis sp. NBC_01488]|uniref:DedA family protein n=1 Tax=Amycolatopsis sp. NBC_01488 TaxID=2903563 RepID=UPI002E2B439C|nr:DedA family protein [Amycolatopsis sp. NBC_01488]
MLAHYGYLAVFGLVFVEGFGPPVPGQSILIVAGVYAGAGQLNIVVVGVIGFLAATGGDNVGFVIGHFGGRKLVLRLGRRLFLTEERLAKAEKFFDRRGGLVVVIARFIDGLRQANGIVAGLAGMSWWRFLAFNALGAALWVGVWTSAGYFAGDHIEVIYGQFQRYEWWVLAALAVLVALLVARWIVRRRRVRPAEPTEPTEGPKPVKPTTGSADGGHPVQPGDPQQHLDGLGVGDEERSPHRSGEVGQRPDR